MGVAGQSNSSLQKVNLKCGEIFLKFGHNRHLVRGKEHSLAIFVHESPL